VGHQVQYPGITLKVIPEVNIFINDLLQVVDRRFEIAAAEGHSRIDAAAR